MQVLIEPFKNGFRARTGAPWDLVTEQETEQKALDQIRQMLREREQSGVKIVEIDCSIQERQNPWLAVAGMFQNDPTFDQWQQEIRNHRRLRDNEAP